MQIDFPLHFDGRGRTAEATSEKHVRDLIEQVMFTSPGERVNRPTFGSPLRQLVFAPNSDMLAGAVQIAVQGALQMWLAEVIAVEAVGVESDDAVLRVTVQYAVRQTGERRTAAFTRDTETGLV